MLLALEELAVVDVGRASFTTRARRDPVLPHTIILLPASHVHLALPMPLTVLELALVHVAVFLPQLAATMGLPVTTFSEIKVTLRCCCHSATFLLLFFLLIVNKIC